MVQRSNNIGTPASYLTAWPNGQPAKGANPEDTVVRAAGQLAQLVARLEEQQADDSMSLRGLAEKAELSHPGLRKILLGEVWPDYLTTFRLEGLIGDATAA